MSFKIKMKNMATGLFCISALALMLTAALPISQTASALTMAEGATAAKSPEQQASLFDPGGLFQEISNVALFLLGAVSVLMLIYGGIRYTISGGDSAAVTSAKNTILYAIVGIIVALLAYAIVSFVIGSLSTPTTPAATTTTTPAATTTP